jgi:hypothetical protein
VPRGGSLFHHGLEGARESAYTPRRANALRSGLNASVASLEATSESLFCGCVLSSCFLRSQVLLPVSGTIVSQPFIKGYCACLLCGVHNIPPYVLRSASRLLWEARPEHFRSPALLLLPVVQIASVARAQQERFAVPRSASSASGVARALLISATSSLQRGDSSAYRT